MGRKFWLDLSCLGNALLKDADLFGDDNSEVTPEEFRKLLMTIDPGFEDFLPNGHEMFLQRIQALRKVWSKERIPVHKTELASAEEILHVFTRVNLEGARTSPADIFFAGVKTCWNDAEELLDEMTQTVKGLNRYDALRLVARLASSRKERQDLIPLDLNRLKGDKGRELVDEMKGVVRSIQIVA